MKLSKCLAVCGLLLLAHARFSTAQPALGAEPFRYADSFVRSATEAQFLQVAGENKQRQSWETLSLNQRRAIQRQLNAMGHQVGAPDGKMGSGTRRGITSFQLAMSAEQTGVLTSDQISSLMQRDDYARAILALDGPKIQSNPRVPLRQVASCETVQSDLQAVAAKIKMSFDSSKTQVGSDLNITIEQPGRTNRPLFAVLAFNRDVRFTGEKLYALLPNARAPFDLTWKAEQTRIFVPLHVRGTKEPIKFGMIPMALQPLVVSASLLAPSDCGEQILELYQQTMRPDVGKPTITVFDEFFNDAPDTRLLSPRGDRVLELFDGFFQIRTTENGVLIDEHEGFGARFSPDGRFVTAGGQGSVLLFDAIDGALMTQSPYAHDVAWDLGGSFLVVGGSGAGVITTHASLFMGPALAETRTSCRVCPATSNSTYRLDLENHVAISTGNLGEAATPLNGYKKFDTAWGSASGSDIATYGSITNFVNDYSGAAPVVIPQNWLLHDGLGFSHIGLELTEAGGSALENNPLKRFLTKPRELPISFQVLALGESDVSKSVMRGNPRVGAVAATLESRANFVDRLQDAFGLNLIKGTQFVQIEPLGEKLGDRVHRLRIDPRVVLDENGPCNLGEVDAQQGGVLVYSAQNTRIWQATAGNGEPLSLIAGGCRGGSAGYGASVGGAYRATNPASITPVQNGPTVVSVMNPGGGCGDCNISFTLINDRYAHSWSADTSEISIIDMVTGVSQLFLATDGKLIEDYFVTPDGRYAVQLNSDGQFYVYDLSKIMPRSKDAPWEVPQKHPILSGLYANDELVLWDDNGYFEATFEGAQNVFIKFPAVEPLFVIEQYAAVLQRPGLVRSVLETGSFLPTPELGVPPIIRADLTTSQTGGLALSINNEAGGQPHSIQIIQDGLLSKTILWNSNSTSTLVPVDRLPGVQWLSTIVRDANGLASPPQSFDLGPAKIKRNLRVLAIGIDAYTDPRLQSLAAAKTDAFKFINALDTSRSEIYSKVDILPPLGDEEATKTEILKSLDALIADTGPQTDIMLFFAGHGLRSSQNELYLGLTQTDPEDLGGTALPWAAVADRIARAPGRVMVFLDACHSGDAGRSFFGTNDAAAEALLNDLESSVTVFAASKGRQSSLETSQTGGGVFTHAVTQILMDDRAVIDSDKNGVIDLSEFYSNLRKRVEIFSGGQQTPWFTRNRMIGETGFF